MSDPFADPLASKEKYYATIVNTFKKLLHDESGTDLVIKIGNETVHAYAAIVSVRCKEIIGFPDEKAKKKKSKNEVKLKEGVASAAVMHKVLEYLYTGMVDFSKVADKEILLIYKASKQLKLDRLTFLCEEWLIKHMTIEGVFHLLKAATDLQEERIKGFCIKFALEHYNDFIANKDGIYILGIDLFQEVVTAFQSSPTPPKPFNPADVPDTLLDDFKRLYEMMPYSDITLVLGNDTLKCHRCILAAHSETLATAVFRDPETEARLSPAAFSSMLKFCYYGYDVVDTLPACELIAFSRKFSLIGLEEICEAKIRSDINPKTVLKILAVSYLPSEGKKELVNELRAKCVPYILENLDSIDFNIIKSFNPLMIVDLLLELQTGCKSNQFGLQKICSKKGDLSGSHGKSREKKKPPPAPSRKTSVQNMEKEKSGSAASVPVTRSVSSHSDKSSKHRTKRKSVRPDKKDKDKESKK